MSRPGTKNIHVADVPLDALERARQYAIADGVPRADLAVMRYALCQFVQLRKLQDEEATRQANEQGSEPGKAAL